VAEQLRVFEDQDSEELIREHLQSMLAIQRDAVNANPYPDVAIRKDRIQRAIADVVNNQDRLIAAMAEDFGQRAEMDSLLADILYPLNALKHALKHVDQWVRPEKRKADFPFNILGAKAYVFYQPLGVVGVISPWNLPFGLAYAPLAGIFAAGNRAMIKPSELTPNTSALIADMVASSFDQSELTVVQGGLNVAKPFAELPFDHLIFTGSAPVARSVMASAAKNLTPVTLELGGKAPVILAKGCDLEQYVGKIASIKTANGGQACMGLDHIMVHSSDRDRFVELMQQKMATFFPNYATNPDVSYVFLQKQRSRLAGLVRDAVASGAQAIFSDGLGLDGLEDRAAFPVTMVVNPLADCALMQDEIFGPVLPIMTYESMNDLAGQIRTRERPLALYFLGGSKQEQEYLLHNTWSGGVTFDDMLFHALQQDLPFGGVGESGMGRYGGHAGFKTFSNARSVAHPPKINLLKMEPPYTEKMVKMIRGFVKP
jgi:coniferyl-aldehyde dehydrogenase